MNEQEALSRMVAPGTRRSGKYREGVIQIHVTRACDKACFGCTQGSQLASASSRGGNPGMITLDQFETAVKSLVGYFGVVGVFGGNPALHPRFEELCDVLARHIPWEQRGLWCNNPINESKALAMRRTFNPSVSNLNVHLDGNAFELFRRHWPEARPVGSVHDSRHSPCYVAMKDVLKKDCPECLGKGYRTREFTQSEKGEYPQHEAWIEGPCSTCRMTGKVYDEEMAWELISDCDINKHWSAMIGVFRGEVRAWFCEIAGAQAMLHQAEPDYPDTGLPLDDPSLKEAPWWDYPMSAFSDQVNKHCHECSVPLRGYGELAQAKAEKPRACPECVGGFEPGTEDEHGAPLPARRCPTCEGSGFLSSPQEAREQVSETHRSVFRPKDKARRVELVTVVDQIRPQALGRMTDYLGNSKR